MLQLGLVRGRLFDPERTGNDFCTVSSHSNCPAEWWRKDRSIMADWSLRLRKINHLVCGFTKDLSFPMIEGSISNHLRPSYNVGTMGCEARRLVFPWTALGPP
jgi:hypothetical protein